MSRVGVNRFEGGDLCVRSLQALGVERVFSVSGGPLNSIYHAAASHGLPLVHTRHEAAACFMAEAAARTSGRAGVAAVTLGPGVTNTVTPALVAKLGGTPLLILGAQTATRNFDRGAGMSADHLPIMAPITKWCARVLHTARIPEYLEAAWRHMWAGRPGPVFLEIPVDVLAAGAEAGSPAEYRPHRFALEPEERDALLAAVAAARRPFLLLGDEVHWDRPPRLREVVERLHLPFVTLRLGRGAIDEHHPLWAGPGYTPCNATLRSALGEADLVLLLGHHFEFDLEFGSVVPPATRVVQCVSDPELLGRNRRAEVGLLASPGPVVSALGSASPGPVDRGWVRRVVEAWHEERGRQGEIGTPVTGDDAAAMHPVTAVDAIVEAAPADTVFVTSHGNVDFWADARIRVRRPGSYLRAGQAGALGAEIPYGVGARFADPERPVVVIVGDGGVGYHVTELDTAARYDRPVVVAVLDDEKWAAIALPQRQAYGGEFEMGLPRRDWMRVAQALGGFGAGASTPAEVQDALRSAIGSGLPSVIQIPVRSVLSPYMAFISG